MSDTELFKQVVKHLGGPVATSRLLNFEHYQSVQQMKRFRPEHCPVIERATDGKFTCEQLRPDVDWAYLRGTKKAA